MTRTTAILKRWARVAWRRCLPPCGTGWVPGAWRQIRRGGSPCHPGFTLMEVLASLLLLAVVLPVVMSGASLSLRAAEDSRYKAQASLLAQAELSQLLAANQWELQKMTGDFGASYPQYRWTALLTNYEDSTLLQLDVTVTWRQRESSFGELHL